MIITIDGPSASGKSSLAKNLSKKLHFIHLDSGAIYRSIAYFLHKRGLVSKIESGCVNCLKDFSYHFSGEQENKRHFVCDRDVTQEIRTREISELSSKISVYKEIRAFATNLQRDLASGNNIVIEGRDTGSVVFPDAQMKFYLDADAEQRARRRFSELRKIDSTLDISYEEILVDVKKRDERDLTREFSPLLCPKGAKRVDTTSLSLDEVFSEILAVVKDEEKKKGKKENYIFSHKGGKCSFVYILTKWLFIAYFRLFHKYRVYGLENYEKNSAAIIACNHLSFYDPPMVAAACPEVVHGVARKSLFKNKLISYWFRKINTYPITGTSSDKEMMKKVFEILKNGEKIIIFPEGTRSIDGNLKPLRKGLSLLADKGNAKVIPTAIIGSFTALPANTKLPKFFTPLKVVFGEPIYFSRILKEAENKKEAREIFLKKVHDAILELIDSHK